MIRIKPKESFYYKARFIEGSAKEIKFESIHTQSNYNLTYRDEYFCYGSSYGYSYYTSKGRSKNK